MRFAGLQLSIALALAVAACGGSSRSAAGQTPPPDASGKAPPGTAGRACTTPDDSTGTSISGTFKARPEPLYAVGAAVLREMGYAVLENVPPRELMTAPSYTWPSGTANDSWHGAEHPGIEVFIFTRTERDSTTVSVGARALCRVTGSAGGQRDSEVGRNLEGIITLTVMNALINRLRGTPQS